MSEKKNKIIQELMNRAHAGPEKYIFFNQFLNVKDRYSSSQIFDAPILPINLSQLSMVRNFKNDFLKYVHVTDGPAILLKYFLDNPRPFDSKMIYLFDHRMLSFIPEAWREQAIFFRTILKEIKKSPDEMDGAERIVYLVGNNFLGLLEDENTNLVNSGRMNDLVVIDHSMDLEERKKIESYFKKNKINEIKLENLSHVSSYNTRFADFFSDHLFSLFNFSHHQMLKKGILPTKRNQHALSVGERRDIVDHFSLNLFGNESDYIQMSPFYGMKLLEVSQQGTKCVLNNKEIKKEVEINSLHSFEYLILVKELVLDSLKN